MLCIVATTLPAVTTAVLYQIGGACPTVKPGFGVCPVDCEIDANCTSPGQLCCKNQCGGLTCTAACKVLQCPVKCTTYMTDASGCPTCTCYGKPVFIRITLVICLLCAISVHPTPVPLSSNTCRTVWFKYIKQVQEPFYLCRPLVPNKDNMPPILSLPTSLH